MSRSVHTDPLDIRAQRRLWAPFAPRSAAYRRGASRPALRTREARSFTMPPEMLSVPVTTFPPAMLLEAMTIPPLPTLIVPPSYD